MVSLLLQKWDRWQRVPPFWIAAIESLALLLLGLFLRFLIDSETFLVVPLKHLWQAVVIMIIYGIIVYRHVSKQRKTQP